MYTHRLGTGSDCFSIICPLYQTWLVVSNPLKNMISSVWDYHFQQKWTNKIDVPVTTNQKLSFCLDVFIDMSCYRQ